MICSKFSEEQVHAQFKHQSSLKRQLHYIVGLYVYFKCTSIASSGTWKVTKSSDEYVSVPTDMYPI